MEALQKLVLDKRRIAHDSRMSFLPLGGLRDFMSRWVYCIPGQDYVGPTKLFFFAGKTIDLKVPAGRGYVSSHRSMKKERSFSRIDS